MANGTNEKVLELIKVILDRFGAILRYIAPGFTALFVIYFLYVGRNVSQNKPIVDYPDWLIAGGAALAGVWIYALHICVIVRILWLPIILWILRCTPCSYLNNNQRKERIFSLQVKLDEARWTRRGAKKDIQRELDKWGAMQSFLYCSAYVMILIPCLMKWPIRIITTFKNNEDIFVLCLGVITLAAALISEYRHTNREFWAINNLN